jgi:hypothetical protein
VVLTVNDSGQLVVPPELVQAAPRTQIEVERQGDSLVLKHAAHPAPRPSILSLPTFAAGPVDPNLTFRREDIYEDDGR